MLRCSIHFKVAGRVAAACRVLSARRSFTTRADSDLTIGVVGAGGFGRLHCSTIQQLGDVRLESIIDPHANTLEQAGEQFPGVSLYTDLEQATTEQLCDAYIIASSSNTHVRTGPG